MASERSAEVTTAAVTPAGLGEPPGDPRELLAGFWDFRRYPNVCARVRTDSQNEPTWFQAGILLISYWQQATNDTLKQQAPSYKHHTTQRHGGGARPQAAG